MLRAAIRITKISIFFEWQDARTQGIAFVFAAIVLFDDLGSDDLFVLFVARLTPDVPDQLIGCNRNFGGRG